MKPSPDFQLDPAEPGVESLGLGPAARPGRRLGPWLWRIAVVLVLAIGIVAWLYIAGTPDAPRYQTTEVTRGGLTVTVSATGTLQPTNQVDVGSELSGTVQEVLVDDNSTVTKGQVLARLDVSRLQDQIVNALAALDAARATVLQAEATRGEAAANLARLREVFALSGGKVPSKAELETAQAALARAEASVGGARAGVNQAQAALSTHQINLSKASVKSPIAGVVLARKVEPGQTVAASLQAPVLFTLAEDLARMELQVKVDEADVGQVREGQRAEFTVDAYPGRRYPATIRRVSFGATTTDNVVSYLTVLSLSNDDLSLRPGMTATAEIVTDERQDVLLVPNAALRFSPPRTAQAETSLLGSLMPRPPRAPKRVRDKSVPEDLRRLWVLRDGSAQELEVKAGATNGRVTEIMAGPLEEGMAVITAIASGAR